jgi:hypothetical protein
MAAPPDIKNEREGFTPERATGGARMRAGGAVLVGYPAELPISEPGHRPVVVLPVTAKWSRRLRAQHSSVESWQTGTSLP